MRKKIHYSNTLYFFPAILPLAELLPWLLTLLGLVAGVARFSFPAYWKKHRRAVSAAVILGLALIAGAFFWLRPAKAVRSEGSQLVATAALPAPVATAAPQAQSATKSLPAFGELWTHKTEQAILASPVMSGGLLLYGTFGHTVNAASPADGAEAWSLGLKQPVFSVTEGRDGIVYSGEGLHDTQSASLTALRAKDGTVLWQREFLGHLEETVALDEAHHRLWVSAGPGGLWALDPRDGDVLWHQALGHIDSRPLLLDGTLYVPADVDERQHKTFFYALGANKGTVRWSLSLPGQPWGSPLADRTGKIILNTTGVGQIGVQKDTDKGWAQGISTDGKLLWQVDLPGMVLQPGIYMSGQDIVIYLTKNGHLLALRGADGSVVWHEQPGREFAAPPALITGFKTPMIATSSYDGVFSIRNVLTGAELARRPIAARATASPLPAGDTIYVPGLREITAFGGVHALAETP